MTPDHIHDALTLLPSDLIAEADKKRQGAPKIIVWKRFAAMAACFALVLGCSWYALTLFGGSVTEQAAAEVPMMQGAPSLSDKSAAVEEAAPMEPAASPESAEEGICGLPTAPRQENSTTAAAGTPKEDNLSIHHAHRPAEPIEEDSTKAAGSRHSGTTATLRYGAHCYTLYGESLWKLKDLLSTLSYDPGNLCRCMEEATVSFGTSSYGINLTEYFVRHDGGQAALTEEQAAQIRQIIEETIPNLDALSYSSHQVITPSLDGYHSDHHTTLITSRAELERYWETFSQRYDFSAMRSICAIYGYDDAWFEENDLLLNVVFSKIGVSNTVTAITDAGGNLGWDWEILISINGLYDPDNEDTVYHLITRLEKGVISPEDSIIAVYDAAIAEGP